MKSFTQNTKALLLLDLLLRLKVIGLLMVKKYNVRPITI